MWRLLDRTQIKYWLESVLKLNNYAWQKITTWILLIMNYDYHLYDLIIPIRYLGPNQNCHPWYFHIFNIIHCCPKWNTNVSFICWSLCQNVRCLLHLHSDIKKFWHYLLLFLIVYHILYLNFSKLFIYLWKQWTIVRLYHGFK